MRVLKKTRVTSKKSQMKDRSMNLSTSVKLRLSCRASSISHSSLKRSLICAVHVYLGRLSSFSEQSAMIRFKA